MGNPCWRWAHENRLPHRQASTFKGLVLFCTTTTLFTISSIGLGLYLD